MFSFRSRVNSVLASPLTKCVEDDDDEDVDGRSSSSFEEDDDETNSLVHGIRFLLKFFLEKQNDGLLVEYLRWEGNDRDGNDDVHCEVEVEVEVDPHRLPLLPGEKPPKLLRGDDGALNNLDVDVVEGNASDGTKNTAATKGWTMDPPFIIVELN